VEAENVYQGEPERIHTPSACQTGLIDAVIESTHIPQGRLKNTPTPATPISHTYKEGLERK
jgi:hypothetical protein